MKIEAFLLFSIIFLLAILVSLSIANARFFKKNEHKYNVLLSKYRQRGLDIDLVTNVASYFGALALYQKIIWFVRLHKGVRMKYTKERYVQPEAYHFVQSLPQDKIGWILTLHRRLIIQFAIVTLWFLILAAIWIFLK
ncbi:hypothetical protein ACP26F_13190 [Franconibacter pulveris 1160]|uniref:Universal stress protein B n=1 Tax=Franconibacter pulveris TaxID=435910 RepID=A0A0J8VK58_9ENTR|nr:hypothetical protein [Franconibacter pulveris]KMV32865.1 hypothetical protein ACH50_19210 [Franconibacter pulveris]